VQRLSQQIEFTSTPILTGKNASERRASMYSEREGERMNQLKAAQAALSAFDDQAKIEDDYAAKRQSRHTTTQPRPSR
jgi:hypothetical protein